MRGGGGGRRRRRLPRRRSRGEGTGRMTRRRRGGETRTWRRGATRSPGRASPRARGTGGGIAEGEGVRKGRDEVKAPRAADSRARESREGGKHPEKEKERRAGTEARGVGRTSSSWISCARARDEGARARVARGDARAEAGGGDGGAETEREGRHRGETSSSRRGAQLAAMKSLEAPGGDDRARVGRDNDKNAATRARWTIDARGGAKAGRHPTHD